MEFCQQNNRPEGDNFSALHYRSFNIEALFLWCISYVQRDFELSVHEIKYMHRKGSPFDFQTSTHWNVIGCSVIAQPCYCPIVFFHNLGLNALSFPQRNDRRITKISFLFFKLLISFCILMFSAIIRIYRRLLPNDTNGFAVLWLLGLT
jgi:hypothetical protein